MPELSIIVPTRDRPSLVAELVRRLADQRDATDFELLVVDGSHDDATAQVVQASTGALRGAVRYLREPRLPSPAARNAALRAASGPVCLFLNDDCWPLEGLLERHARFHRENPEATAAMIGRTIPYWPYEPTTFERWLESSGFRHRYDAIRDNDNAGWQHFLTFNASAKLPLLRQVKGFDERFEGGFEDNELGLRLERAGMHLGYDPEAMVEHFHPAGLADTLFHFRRYGRGRRLLGESRGEPRPRSPGTRHRLAATGLLIPYALGLRPARVQRAVWRLLCVEAFREGYWHETPPDGGIRVGAALAKLASRDPAARFPATATLQAPSDSANRSSPG